MSVLCNYRFDCRNGFQTLQLRVFLGLGFRVFSYVAWISNSPGMHPFVQAAWGRPVLDRVGLIIEIFGAHAQTREAKLQV